MKNKEYYDGLLNHVKWDGNNFIWIKSRGRAKGGSVAGCPDQKGYMRIRFTINGVTKDVSVHRLVFYMINGWVPPYLDHIDGNSMNNCIDNLRPVTYSQNALNTSKSKGESRFKGVCRSNVSGKWKASITYNRERHELGDYDSETAAAKAYNSAIDDLGINEYAVKNEVTA